MVDTGIYMGTDFEMVVTDEFIISFSRNKQENILESRLFKRTGERYSCIGICHSSSTETEQYIPPISWKTAFIYNGKAVGMCQTMQNPQTVSKESPSVYSNTIDEQIVSYIGSSLTVDAK